MSDKLQNKFKIHQKWGFGMAPPKEHTVVSRRKAVQLVLTALSGGKSSEPNSLADAIVALGSMKMRNEILIKLNNWNQIRLNHPLKTTKVHKTQFRIA